MRRAVAVAVVMVSALGLGASSASAFVGGGRAPSEAATIAWGQHYTGELNNHKEDNNYGGFREVAFYRLPPVSTHDVVTVNWHALPFTHGSGFPVCMILAQGIDDFSWGAVLHSTVEQGYCRSSGPVYELTGSGTAKTEITVQNTDLSSSYLEFVTIDEQTEPARFETYPYDFSVEAPRHALTLSFPAVTSVPANGTLSASITGATGLPAPDGLVYTLTANWKNGGVAIFTAPSVGGHVTFPLALPESAFNQRVRFIVSRAPDAEFQAVESPAINAKVTAPVAPPAPVPSAACKKKTTKVRSLRRQHHRLQANARRARGPRKQRLQHRAHHVGHELHAAREEAKTACG
jgi:hypothetical protein